MPIGIPFDFWAQICYTEKNTLNTLEEPDMTMQKLCGVCTALNTEFNTAAKEMDSRFGSEVRKATI